MAEEFETQKLFPKQSGYWFFDENRHEMVGYHANTSSFLEEAKK
jgi:hypothetical protein